MGKVRLKLDIQCQRRGRNFDRRWTSGWGVMKFGQFSWTSYVYHPLFNGSFYTRCIKLGK